MATVRIVLGIICLVVFGWLVEPNGYFLVNSLRVKKGLGIKDGSNPPSLRLNNQALNSSYAPRYSHDAKALPFGDGLGGDIILPIARSQIGVREASGKNDGKMVEAYLRYTGNKKGEPWCASFVSWVFGQAGFTQPKTAWSPSLFPLARQTLNPLPADVFGIYFPALKRIAHCGLMEKRQGNYIVTIEGNWLIFLFCLDPFCRRAIGCNKHSSLIAIYLYGKVSKRGSVGLAKGIINIADARFVSSLLYGVGVDKKI